jgi:hypothetical protein
MRTAAASLAGILLLATASAVAAESSVIESQRSSIGVEVAFTDDEIRIIRAHYQTQAGRYGKEKGKRKQGSLPPGIAKNVARGKPLPPGIAMQVLPDDLRRALPPARDGYERIIVAGKILLVEIATQVVRDVLTDVIMD